MQLSFLNKKDSSEADISSLSFNIKKANLEGKTVIEYGEIVQSENPHTCFIIPGSFSTAQTWEEPANALMKRNNGKEFGKLVCITPLGMNGSYKDENLPESASNIYVDFLKNNLPKGDLTIIAHSKADENVLEIYGRPELKDRVKRLIVVSPIMTAKGNLIEMIIKSVRSLDFLSHLVDTAKLVKEAIKTSPSGVFDQACTTKVMHAANLIMSFQAAKIPVLVIGSENDIANTNEIKEFANYFPRADVKIMKDGGHHFPFYHPEEFADAIWDWIKSQHNSSA